MATPGTVRVLVRRDDGAPPSPSPASHPPGTPIGRFGIAGAPVTPDSSNPFSIKNSQMTQALRQLQEEEFKKKMRQCQWHQNNVALLEQKLSEADSQHSTCAVQLAALNDSVDQKKEEATAKQKMVERNRSLVNTAKRRQEDAFAELRQINRRRE